MTPIYRWECLECGAVVEAFRKVAQRDDATTCESCDQPTKRVMVRPNVNPDYEPHLDPHLVPMGAPGGTETLVKSRRHKKELLQRLGLGQL